MVTEDPPDYIYEPYTDRTVRWYWIMAVAMLLGFGVIAWFTVGGVPPWNPDGLVIVGLFAGGWLSTGIVLMRVYMARWRRRAKTIFVEGTTVPALIVRKPYAMRGMCPIEVEYTLDGRQHTGKGYVSFKFYVECQVGSEIMVRVLPGYPTLCVPILCEGDS